MFNRIRVPPELKPTNPNVLEDYVRLRIAQYVSLLSQRLRHYAPSLAKDTLDQAAGEALAWLPQGDHGQLSLEDKQLQLVFRHDCLALGCLDPQCALCTHNPSRRCTVNFDRKYLVNDMLKARCGAGIRVELIDPVTAQPVGEKLPEITLQISVLDGNLYDNKFLDSGKQYEGGTEPAEELDACALLQNKKKSTALLQCGSGGSNDAAGYVLLSMVDGKVPLNDLHVTDSSEAILSGRKPPFRLLVRALLPANGPKLNIRHAVSEGFVVATRRTRTAGKADIPSVDDPVSKLEHMGKETVKKLADLATAAEQAGVEIDIPENCVQKVGEFKLLALRADQDGHLRQKLQHVLKLSKDKWDEARDHAMRAVVADNRMRAWYVDRRSCELGVLFTARMGTVDLDRPVGLLQTRIEAGERKTEAILGEGLNPNQREMLREMQPHAVTAWWAPGHPGWAIFPMDSDTFLQGGSLTTAPVGVSALTAAATVAALAVEPPSSPTQSAVSLNTMSQRRHTGGSGGGEGGGAMGGGLSSQSTEVVLPPDTATMGKPPVLQPALPSAQTSLGGGIPLSSLHGVSVHALNSGGNNFPTAFGLPTPFVGGPGIGSGRSSRAGSVTDSPPRQGGGLHMHPGQQSSLSLSHHHSLPQPPNSHQGLHQHTSVQTAGNLQQLPSYHGPGGIQVHPGYQGPGGVAQGMQGHVGLQPHPGLAQNNSLSMQTHVSLQPHMSQRQSMGAPVSVGRAGSFTGMPQSHQHLASVQHHPPGPDMSGNSTPTSASSANQQSGLMPPPLPMGAPRSMMLPPQHPFPMPPPPQPRSSQQHPPPPHHQHQHQLQQAPPLHPSQYRAPGGEAYQQAPHMSQQQAPGLAVHLGPNPDAVQHGMHPAGPPCSNGCVPQMQQQQQGPPSRLQGHDMQQLHPPHSLHPHQQMLGRPHPSQHPPAGSGAQHHRQPGPLPLPVNRGAEDPSEDLQSRGSANPRPHKMPSLGRSLDFHFPVPSGIEKPEGVPAASGGGSSMLPPASGGPGSMAPPSHALSLNRVDSPPELGSGKESAASQGLQAQAKPQCATAMSAPSSGLSPGPRAVPPVPGQSPPGSSPPPPGPPPNPFARVQSNRMNGHSSGPEVPHTDDSDSDDSLGLGTLPLTNSMQAAFCAPSVIRPHQQGGNGDGPVGAGGGSAGGTGAGGAGQLANGGLSAPQPSLHMIDSQQLDMVLAENMIIETSSLNTGISGLFLPPAMALPEGIGMLGATHSKELLKPTSSGLLKPTTSGLDTMASMELALPNVRKSDALTVGQEPKASGSAGANATIQAPASAVGMGVVSNRMLGPYAR